jgi:hydroxyacylglutathione hydrolase
MKLKELPKNTKVFCGHEYTLQNSKFCIAHDENNENLKAKINDIKIKLESNLPTIPSTIKDELECNIFLRSQNIETFSKLRDLKDNF